MNKTSKFPLAIKVNARLILSYPLVVFTVLIMVVFLNTHNWEEMQFLIQKPHC